MLYKLPLRELQFLTNFWTHWLVLVLTLFAFTAIIHYWPVLKYFQVMVFIDNLFSFLFISLTNSHSLVPFLLPVLCKCLSPRSFIRCLLWFGVLILVSLISLALNLTYMLMTWSSLSFSEFNFVLHTSVWIAQWHLRSITEITKFCFPFLALI